MSKFIDLTGKKYGKLLVVERAENAKGGIAVWRCLCDCGKTSLVRGSNLKSGAVQSCGCLKHQPAHNRTHGLSKDPLYMRWNQIKMRCLNPSCKSYGNYGGRGIKLCDEWKDSVEAFAKWAIENGYSEELTIERIDNNGDYCPENCKWIPKNEQPNNRRSCYSITYNGKTQNLTEWCKELGLNYKLIHNRMYKHGWEFERAISEPVHVEKRKGKGD